MSAEIGTGSPAPAAAVSALRQYRRNAPKPSMGWPSWWRQVKSLARPVAVLIIIPLLIIMPLSSGSTLDTTRYGGLVAVVHFGAPTGWHIHFGVGSGTTLLVTRIVGVLVALVGVWWFAWAEGTMIANGLTLAPEDYPPMLITWGPWQYVQNPMMIGIYCLTVAEGFLMSPWIWVLSLVFIAWMHFIYLPLHEAPDLYDLFGQRWVTYAATVPKIVPVGLLWRGTRRRWPMEMAERDRLAALQLHQQRRRGGIAPGVTA
jgi:protein-S-isoprenylcysteine O-methyltransferase Ste14